MEEKAKNGRIVWIDVLKGIMILFVLLSHSHAPHIYSRIFAPFFLTMFFFASGYTFSIKKSFKEFLYGKIKRLLIPLLTMGGIKLILACIMKGDSLGSRISGLLLQISGRNDDLWFVGCIFTAYLMFYAIVRLSRTQLKGYTQRMLLYAALLAIIGWLDICIFKVKLPWQMENAAIMTFYMALGFLYRKHEQLIVKKLENNYAVVGILSAAYIILLIAFDGKIDIHRGIYTHPIVYIAMSLMAIIPLIFLIKRLCCLKHSGEKFFCFLGKNTLFYYAFEGYVIQPFYAVCGKLGWDNAYVLSLLCIASVVIALLPFVLLVNRFAPWVVGGKK